MQRGDQADATSPTEKISSADGARVGRISFGNVTVFHHERTLDDSKLPSDGMAPLGLGALLDTSEHTLDKFESERRQARGPKMTDGALVFWDHMPPQLRGQLIGASAEDLEAVAQENSILIREREQGLTEAVVQEMLASGCTSDAPLNGETYASNGAASYSTAAPDEARTGAGGGFCELDDGAEEQRRHRAEEEESRKRARKAERVRCTGCKRYACIC